jgi:F-type H+-transporting ATPase subunit a
MKDVMGNNREFITKELPNPEGTRTEHIKILDVKPEFINQNNEQQNNLEIQQKNTTPKTGHNEAESANVFTHLFSELGDHHGLIIGPYHIADLPMIFIDNGIHIYTSTKAMESAGLFTMHNGHPVRTSDHQSPALDLSVTNLVFFQWIALFILAIVFFSVRRKYKKAPAKAPSGFQNMIEVVITYIRNEIVQPNIPSHKVSERLLPYFIGLFFSY